MVPLPIDGHVPRIVAAAREFGAAVVVAPPGAGKTTRVPPALCEDGPTFVLQPRRVAARALARRIALERGWALGETVGWHVRFERQAAPGARLVVATEGVLTARLQSDPLLDGVRTVVLDEFHERSLHADLAIALVRQARRARPDLRVVVMSATVDPRPVAEFLGDCPVIEVPGRAHPVDVEHRPGLPPVDAIRDALAGAAGHVLVFLPGAPEIRRLAAELSRALPSSTGIAVLPLHGSLSADEQDAALAPSAGRKVILATNVAETSLTVDGVTVVVDGGLHKVLRRDAGLGIDRLETERIPRDSAEQRAGRAGRTGPGRVLRLWDARDELRPRREPEIARVDLAAPLLDVLAWGGDPRRFEWFEAPPGEAVDAALDLLERLGATERSGITPLGRALRALPLHPRLGRLLLDDGASPRAALVAAALAEGWTPAGVRETTDSDLLWISDHARAAPPAVREAARELERHGRRLAGEAGRHGGDAGEARFLRAVLAAFPDRAARRREPGSARVVLASGHGGRIDPESGVRAGEFLVAVDLRAGRRGPGAEARVRLASRIEPAWLPVTGSVVEHVLDAPAGVVRAAERGLHGAIVLSERPVAPDPARAGEILAADWLARPLDERSQTVLRRLGFAGIDVDVGGLVRRAFAGRTRRLEIDLGALLSPETTRLLERLAPETLRVPSGRRVRLDYRDDGKVVAAVKLQELFGLADSPRVGSRGVPVTFSLLAPSGRPVQATSDLRSFWQRTYPDLRRALRGRYPKHRWPEDPLAAPPTAASARRDG